MTPYLASVISVYLLFFCSVYKSVMYVYYFNMNKQPVELQ